MSDRDAFVRTRQKRWMRLENLLATTRISDPESGSELATLYREICADLSRAQTLGLADDVQRHLDKLAGRAHSRLYGSRRGVGMNLIRTIAVGFPRESRRQWAFMLAAHVLFYGPFIIGIVGPLLSDVFAPSVLPAASLQEMEAMYGSNIERSADQDTAMAGFYVWNNVGIAFRCFATGAIFGLGSVFYLVYNGLVLGTIEGHLWAKGLGWTLTDFTVGHSPWELTGIAVSGAAGLKLGWALVSTGGRTRVGSVRAAAPALYNLIVGATVMLLVAAAIEGFWSSGSAPLPVKIGFGVAGAIVVIAWMFLGGRGADR